MVYEYKLAKSNCWFNLAYVAISICFGVFLITYLLPNNRDILHDIIIMGASLAGGFGAGYGYRSHRDK